MHGGLFKVTAGHKTRFCPGNQLFETYRNGVQLGAWPVISIKVGDYLETKTPRPGETFDGVYELIRVKEISLVERNARCST
jgi:hypothetical protein